MSEIQGALHTKRDEAGFTIVELLVSMVVLLVVSGIVIGGTIDLTRLGTTLTNRSDMHSGVRNATALLQQEVGQAGRASLPAPVKLVADVGTGHAKINVSSTDGMFEGEQLLVGTGSDLLTGKLLEETVTVTEIDHDADVITIKTPVTLDHKAGAPVAAMGGFSAGVVPTTPGMTNGSDGQTLKIVGDINGDGRMVYVEYTCDLAAGRLYRNEMPFDAATKPPLTVERVLLDNLLENPVNPGGTGPPPCFTYEERTFGGTTYVIGVAIMTTVRTQAKDRQTKDYQRMTKALLNVAPRNVVNVWQMASFNYINRVQPLPESVKELMKPLAPLP
jgi:prepilin-type N-terminal cleavage/methylation domain-containing protein